MFNEGQLQPPPPARTFMRIGVTGPSFAAYSYDWSRIVAVLVDEPYGPQNMGLVNNAIIDHLIKYPDGSPVCPAPPAAVTAIATIDTLLQQRAMDLEAVAPQARFWVNFTGDEANWMAVCGTQSFNRTYIDVISADWYDVQFSTLQPFYTVVAGNPAKPDQQLALVPGVFSAPVNQGPFLAAYFSYANTLNQTCNLPLGSRGVTGSYDGCRVWIVLGWLSGNYNQYVGMLDTRSSSIKSAWEGELGLPLRPDLAHQLTRAHIILPVLNEFLLNN